MGITTRIGNGAKSSVRDCAEQQGCRDDADIPVPARGSSLRASTDGYTRQLAEDAAVIAGATYADWLGWRFK